MFKTSARMAGSFSLRQWPSCGRSRRPAHASVAAPGFATPLLRRPPRSLPTSRSGFRPWIKKLLRVLLLFSLRLLERGTSYCRSERRRGALCRKPSWARQRRLAGRTPQLERGCGAFLLQLGDDHLALHLQDVKKFEVAIPLETRLRTHESVVRIASEPEEEVLRN